jgi:hypothetical protein
MEILDIAFRIFSIAVPIAVGAAMMLFNRRFSVAVIQYQKSIMRVGYGEAYLKLVRAGAFVVGAILVLGGLLAASQILFP